MLGPRRVPMTSLPVRSVTIVSVTLAVLLLGVLGGGVAPGHQPAGPTYTSEDETALQASASQGLGLSPPYLSQMSMAYDPAEGFALSFGGVSPFGTVVAYTLTYAGGVWSNLTSSLPNAPPARTGGALAYDPADQSLVLFGGCLTASCYPALSDTWMFANGSWSLLPTSVGPSPRAFAAMTWDATDQALVLFGGEQGTTSGSFAYYGDTWLLSNNRWTNVTGNLTGPSPAPRADAGFAGTSVSPATLFGGLGTIDYSDTWTYQNLTWSNVTAAAGPGPSARRSVGFAGNVSGVDVLFGGYYHGNYLSDTWALSEGHWSRLSTSGPPGTFSAGFVWDTAASRFVLYGGLASESTGAGTSNAVWLFSGTAWFLTNPSPPEAFPWILLLPVLLIPVLVLETIIIFRRQRKQFQQLSDQMPPVAGEQAEWFVTDKASTEPWVRRRKLIPLIIVLPGLLILLTLTQTDGGFTELIGIVTFVSFLALSGALAVLFSRAQARSMTTAVGLLPQGVLVKRPGSDLRIPWAYLQPPTTVPKGPFFFFRFGLPAKGSVGGGFSADRAQTLAILTSRWAPPWVLSPPVRSALDMPVSPQPLQSAGIPHADPAVANFVYPGSRPEAPPSPNEMGAPPPPPPQSPASSPPGPWGAPLSATLPPPPTPSAQVRRCPRCGRLSMLSSRFCPNCGAPFAGR